MLIKQQATENGQYELVSLPKSEGPVAGDGKDIPSDGKKGTGASAIFVARNRLAALDKTAQVGFSTLDFVQKLITIVYRNQRFIQQPYQICQVSRSDHRYLLWRYRILTLGYCQLDRPL